MSTYKMCMYVCVTVYVRWCVAGAASKKKNQVRIRDKGTFSGAVHNKGVML